MDVIWDSAVRLRFDLVGSEQEPPLDDGRHRVENLDTVVNHVSETKFRADWRLLRT